MYLLRRAAEIIRTSSLGEVEELRRQAEELRGHFDEARAAQQLRMQGGQSNIGVGYVYLNMLQESREIASSIRHIVRAAKSFRD